MLSKCYQFVLVVWIFLSLQGTFSVVDNTHFKHAALHAVFAYLIIVVLTISQNY